MFANTHNRETIEATICEYFGISKNEFDSFKNEVGASKVQYDIEQFIGNHTPKKKIESICFFHLSRTLNSENNYSELLNLFALLTTENAFTQFFSEHDVTFDGKEGKIHLWHENKEIPINTDELNCYRPRLKKRFGYLSSYKDFCVNGFLFRDLLYENRYSWSLFNVPEIVGDIAGFLNQDSIGFDYHKNSTFYCYEYHVPLEEIIFDGNISLNSQEKELHLINLLLKRVTHYIFDDFSSNDDDNCILRLADNQNLSAKYFVARDIVTQNDIHRF